MKARLTGLARSMEGEFLLTLSTRDGAVVEAYNDLHENPVSIELKKWREKRSLDANGYAWCLLDKLAAARGLPKDEVYRQEIRGIGGVSETVCVKDKAVDRLTEFWGHNGIGWFCECIPSKIPGCTNVILYYGSSVYDTHQMSALIDHIVQDCKVCGIETLPPQELERLTQEWR